MRWLRWLFLIKSAFSMDFFTIFGVLGLDIGLAIWYYYRCTFIFVLIIDH